MTQETEQIDPTWPPEVALILTALAAGRWADERRSTPRRTYRVKAGLRLYTDDPGSERRCLFTSNVSRRGLGFLTQHRLPLGYGGTVEIPAPDNRTLKVECTLLRCRQAAPGWYEGALHFIRDQEDFDAAVSSEQKFDLY
ncbi:MAG: PilZ domain-containing protein [Tepidisphaeraceae bacterium]